MERRERELRQIIADNGYTIVSMKHHGHWKIRLKMGEVEFNMVAPGTRSDNQRGALNWTNQLQKHYEEAVRRHYEVHSDFTANPRIWRGKRPDPGRS